MCSAAEGFTNGGQNIVTDLIVIVPGRRAMQYPKFNNSNDNPTSTTVVVYMAFPNNFYRCKQIKFVTRCFAWGPHAKFPQKLGGSERPSRPLKLNPCKNVAAGVSHAIKISMWGGIIFQRDGFLQNGEILQRFRVPGRHPKHGIPWSCGPIIILFSFHFSTLSQRLFSQGFRCVNF